MNNQVEACFQMIYLFMIKGIHGDFAAVAFNKTNNFRFLSLQQKILSVSLDKQSIHFCLRGRSHLKPWSLSSKIKARLLNAVIKYITFTLSAWLCMNQSLYEPIQNEKYRKKYLPHLHQLRPGKTKTHSVYTQFCSCDAQQMNTVNNKNASATVM